MTGFEPATTRPPDVDSTGLSYIPKCCANVKVKNGIYKKDNKKIFNLPS